VHLFAGVRLVLVHEAELERLATRRRVGVLLLHFLRELLGRLALVGVARLRSTFRLHASGVPVRARV
jgi:hypothetical protein